MPHDLVFARYTPAREKETQHDTTRLFQDVLNLLAVIDENGDILQAIEEEIKYMEQSEANKAQIDTDYTKTQKLKKFKELLEAHLREHEQDGLQKLRSVVDLVKIENEDEKKNIAAMFIERQFLSGLQE